MDYESRGSTEVSWTQRDVMIFIFFSLSKRYAVPESQALVFRDWPFKLEFNAATTPGEDCVAILTRGEKAIAEIKIEEFDRGRVCVALSVDEGTSAHRDINLTASTFRLISPCADETHEVASECIDRVRKIMFLTRNSLPPSRADRIQRAVKNLTRDHKEGKHGFWDEGEKCFVADEHFVSGVEDEAGAFEWSQGSMSVIHGKNVSLPEVREALQYIFVLFDFPSFFFLLDFLPLDYRSYDSVCTRSLANCGVGANCETNVRCVSLAGSDDSIMFRFPQAQSQEGRAAVRDPYIDPGR